MLFIIQSPSTQIGQGVAEVQSGWKAPPDINTLLTASVRGAKGAGSQRRLQRV